MTFHKAPKQPSLRAKRPRLVFDTPDRECAHADKGCCPTCIDPMQVKVIRGFTLETVAHSD